MIRERRPAAHHGGRNTDLARTEWKVASVLVTLMLTLASSSCGSATDNSSSGRGPRVDEAKFSGIVAVSRDSALVLSESSGEMKFGQVKSHDIVFGAAKAAPKSLLLDAMETPSGEWLAVTATCMEDSGNACSQQTLYRVSPDMKQAEAIALGSAAATDQLRVRAASESGTFAVETSNDTSIQLGMVEPNATDVAWFWKSEPFDLEAIMAAATASQDFEAHRPPRVDVCSSGDRFIWRFHLAPVAAQGWEIEASNDKPSVAWVPSVDEMGPFACTQDAFVSYGSSALGGPITRKSAAIPAKGASATQAHPFDETSSEVSGVASTNLRANGSLVAQVNDPEEMLNPTSGTTRVTTRPERTGTPGSDQTATTLSATDGSPALDLPAGLLVYWRPGAPQPDTLFEGPPKGQHIVTDEGKLIGWQIGDRVQLAD